MADSDAKCSHSVGSGTLAEQVYRRLGAAILSGELAPGAKISEPALARQYGVSRGPLREALHRLQERKLITRSTNHGPRVIKPTPEALVELFVVREALEGMAARLAAMHATDAELAELRAIVTDNTVGSDDPQAAVSEEQHNHDFHSTIARCSRNPMLVDLLCGELYALLRLYRGIELGVRPSGRPAIVEHARILSAIEDHDPDLAEMLMRRHIASARGRREAALVQNNADHAVPSTGRRRPRTRRPPGAQITSPAST
jgi:DNA-binding GntR family transcriptional regulator